MKMVETIRRRLALDPINPPLRKMLVAVIGTTIVLAGLLMIFLPGPGILVILIGLALLATDLCGPVVLFAGGVPQPGKSNGQSKRR